MDRQLEASDEERSYEDGSRQAWRTMLAECLRHLQGAAEIETARLVAEIAEARSVLRRVCTIHGDNDWDDNLHIADVIDKHLERHLDERLTPRPFKLPAREPDFVKRGKP